MPNLDKTGPAGKGPKTGRGLGNCDDKKSINPKTNKGLGRGLGRRGRR